ncbi:ATP synthase subunit I [Psychromonas aquimarina]|uniref:ATP synthase subunit I n=1 Tax=Psychromonas aquimarina TaxID=444919 RepID=UPI00048F70DD|nr:ATP synthase subunit I [Psychromonas aquimarina]
MAHSLYELAIRSHALKLLLGQLLLVVFMVLMTEFTSDHRSARSALLGGLIFLVPQFIFTKLSFLFMGKGKQLLTNSLMLFGYFCKFTLMILLFAVVLNHPQVDHFNLFITFTIVMFSQVFSLLRPLPAKAVTC